MAKCGLMPPGLGPFIQLLLFSTCVLVLKLKYDRDTSGRSGYRFLFDSSKQFAGAAWMHVLNLMVASSLGSMQAGNACTWYFIEIVTDCTIGVWIEYHLLKQLRNTLHASQHERMKELGHAIEADCIEEPQKDVEAAKEATAGRGAGGILGEPLLPGASPALRRTTSVERVRDGLRDLWIRLDKIMYAKQLASWLLVVTGMKIAMVTLMLVLSKSFYDWASKMLSPLENNPTSKLVAVMIITPCVMNGVQFWLQDNIFLEVSDAHSRQRSGTPSPGASPPKPPSPLRAASTPAETAAAALPLAPRVAVPPALVPPLQQKDAEAFFAQVAQLIQDNGTLKMKLESARAKGPAEVIAHHGWSGALAAQLCTSDDARKAPAGGV